MTSMLRYYYTIFFNYLSMFFKNKLNRNRYLFYSSVSCLDITICAFLDLISTAEDNQQFSVRVYLDTFNHLSDNMIIVFFSMRLRKSHAVQFLRFSVAIRLSLIFFAFKHRGIEPSSVCFRVRFSLKFIILFPDK